ncbi:MAG: universal stress protein [Fulvivirga sp.]|uniref:universal stress protein n=1 Tax=Fulvivirga sp. TaxID=1931237 RepID=UPI0032EDD88F
MIKILLPTDFSDSANEAAKLAIEICKLVKASITFLHLMSFPQDYDQLKPEQRKKKYPDITHTHEMALVKLNELNNEARNAELSSESLIRNESSLDFVKDYASKYNFDLIVLGYKSSNDTLAKKYNSFAKHLVDTSETPVLILKRPINTLKKAALLSDFSDEYVINEPWINSFITKLKIDLTLACINTPSVFFDTRTAMQRMDRYKKHYDTPPASLLYNDYQFGSGIKHLCEDLKLDLIIMNTHGKTRRTYSGSSITSQVVASTNCSILSLPVGV